MSASAKRNESSVGHVAGSEVMHDRLRIVSHYPGRLRVRAETFRVVPEVGEQVAQRIAGEPGVSEATTSALTGSLLVTYDPRQLQLPRLIGLLVRAGGLHGVEIEPPDPSEKPSRGGDRIREAADRVNQALRAASAGRLDANVAFPATLFAGGLFVLLTRRGPRMPGWYDLVFWGLMTFLNLNPRKDAERDEPSARDLGDSGQGRDERRSG